MDDYPGTILGVGVHSNLWSQLQVPSPMMDTTEYTSTRMNDLSPQPRAPSEEIAGLVERVTFFNEESGFAVLRVKVRGHRDQVTVLGPYRQ